MPRPFQQARVFASVPAGQTVDEILEGFGIRNAYTGVTLNGVPVESDYYRHLRPKPGTRLTARVVPGKGGGGDKNPLATILSLAIGAATFGIGAALPAGLSAFTKGLIQGAVGLVGQLLVSAIAPPPTQKLSTLTGESPKQSKTYSITGVRNSANQFGVVPRVFGTHKIYPPLGAPQFTELEGNDQFLRALFVVGYGELSISDIKIGETPVSNFIGAETVTRPGTSSDGDLSLASNVVIEESLSIDITPDGETTGAGAASNGPGSWAQRTTEPNTIEIIVDVTAPAGLITNTVKGPWNRKIICDIQYKLTTAGSWTSATDLILNDAQTGAAVRRSRRITVSEGQYDVRVRVANSTTGATEPDKITGIVDATFWTSLRSVKNFDPVDPILLPNTATIELRIQASAQLNNVVDQLNCIATSVISDYDSGSGSWITRATSNPASIYREVLQGAANRKAVGDSELDLTTLEEWHTECETQGWEFNGVIDTQATVWEILRDVAAAGRASPAVIDNKFSVVQDKSNATIVQHFTPKNTFGFKGSKTFHVQPHALKVRFVNALEEYQQDERIVYDDGFDASNASEFEVVEMPYITDPDLIWRHARFQIAQGRLRPETYEFSADVEHIVCTRGDRVKFTHDVPLFGITAGRIKTVTTDVGGDATDLTLDEPVTLEAGKTYAIRIRKADGSTLLNDIVTNVGTSTSVELSPAISAANIPEVGDLFLFGESGSESVDLLVTEVRPAADLTARLICKDYAEAVYTADTGTIPAYDPQITVAPELNKPRPPMPVIETVKSGEEQLVRSASGAIQTRILVTLTAPSGLDVLTSRLKVERRLSTNQERDNAVFLDTETVWRRVGIFESDATALSIFDVQDGFYYDLRFRYETDSPLPGLTSEWSEVPRHKVIGKSSPPGDITVFLRQGNQLIWSYVPPVDHAGFEIRYNFGNSRVWESALKAHPQDDVIAGNTFSIGSEGLGQVTYLIKAVDVAGNKSVNAASIVVNLGDPVVENLQLTTDYKVDGFPGTITNGSISGGNLVADDDGGLFWTGNDDEPFWTGNDSNTFWNTQYLKLVYQFDFTPTEDMTPDGILKLEHTITGKGYKIEYREASQSPFWSGNDSAPFWSGDDSNLFWTSDDEEAWLPWPGQITPIKLQTYQFRITIPPGLAQGQITKLQLHVDVPDIVEYLEDFIVAAVGEVRLPVVKTYRAIKNINYSLQDDGNGADNVVTIDKSISGPSIETRQGASRVQGLVDATIQGY